MTIKYPLEYELTPKTIDPGRRWMTLKLKNVGSQDLTGLDINVNSLDAYSMGILGTGSYITMLAPQEEREIPFQVSASMTGTLYITVDGWENGKQFHWESPEILITVGQEAAKLTNLFAMTKPYSLIGDKIRCEASILGLVQSEGLTLEFWADTAGGEFEKLAIVKTKPLAPGETATYSAEITPEEEGGYTIYAYLYDGARRIGRKVEYVYVTES